MYICLCVCHTLKFFKQACQNEFWSSKLACIPQMQTSKGLGIRKIETLKESEIHEKTWFFTCFLSISLGLGPKNADFLRLMSGHLRNDFLSVKFSQNHDFRIGLAKKVRKLGFFHDFWHFLPVLEVFCEVYLIWSAISAVTRTRCVHCSMAHFKDCVWVTLWSFWGPKQSKINYFVLWMLHLRTELIHKS